MVNLRDDRMQLLQGFRSVCSQGLAENEPEDDAHFLKRFLPIRAHYRVLDPDVRLIIGERGSGKSHLFRALDLKDGRRALTDLAIRRRQPVPRLEDADWVVGYHTSRKALPPPRLIRALAENQPDAVQDVWLFLLVRSILLSGIVDKSPPPYGIRDAYERPSLSWDWDELLDMIGVSLGGLFEWLDSLDSELMDRGRFLFVLYDELDRISPGEWGALKTTLQGLVQFWSANLPRWRRIRPKIFLRHDLYRRAAFFGPDISKIAASRADLVWATHEFYGVLFKRLLNETDHNDLLRAARIPFQENETLGRIPDVANQDQYEDAVRILFGRYMGTDPRKGLTLRWIPNHLKDGHGRIYPRPLLQLAEEAAELELRDCKAVGSDHLIHHSAVRGALDKVSVLRVGELAMDEFPWIERLRTSFEQANLLVPADPRKFHSALALRWTDSEDKPPSTSPRDLLDYMVELGIFTVRRDGRIDAGDLYLKGFHLKRKGGVARPRAV